jgi:ligand-binding sensor domain-containing protein
MRGKVRTPRLGVARRTLLYIKAMRIFHRWSWKGLGIACAAFAAPLIAQTGVARWVLMDLGRLPSPEVVSIAEDDQGRVYYATRGGLTVEERTGSFRIFTRAITKGGLASDSLTCMGLDRYRDLWLGTDGGGLLVYANGAWRRHTKESTRDGLPDDAVLALAVHREERWIGTRNGFAVLRGSSWTAYSGDRIAGRLPHPAVAAIAVDSSGDKWIGTLGGLVRLSGAVWTRFTPENTDGGLPHHGITALHVDAENAVWVGTQAGVARRNRDGTWLRLGPGSGLGPLLGERVAAVTGGPDDDVWVSLRGGVAHYRKEGGGDWELFTRDNVPGLLTLFVNHTQAGAGGEIRIATQKGVIARIPPPAAAEGPR